MTRITLTLDAEIADALRKESQRDDRPMSSIARRAFASYFSATKASAKPKARRAKA